MFVHLHDITHHHDIDHHHLKWLESTRCCCVCENRSIPNRVYMQPVRGVAELQRDYPDLYICKDYMRVVSCWQDDETCEIPLFGTIHMNTHHVSSQRVVPSEACSTLPPIPHKEEIKNMMAGTKDVKYSVNVKFTLFSGMDLANINQLKSGKETFNHLIRFLVLKSSNKDQIFLPGGSFGKFDNIDDITDELLIGRAIDYARNQLNIDLSPCKHWIRMMEVWYKRNETSRGEKCDYQEITVVFIPDCWNGSPVIPSLKRVLAEGEVVPKVPEVTDITEEKEAKEAKETTGETDMVEEDPSKNDEMKEEEQKEDEEESVVYTPEILNAFPVADLRALLDRRGEVSTVSYSRLCVMDREQRQN